jgi:hypothetical protein
MSYSLFIRCCSLRPGLTLTPRPEIAATCFIGRWRANNMRFLAPSLADVAYKLKNYVRLVIAAIIWGKRAHAQSEHAFGCIRSS